MADATRRWPTTRLRKRSDLAKHSPLPGVKSASREGFVSFTRGHIPTLGARECRAARAAVLMAQSTTILAHEPPGGATRLALLGLACWLAACVDRHCYEQADCPAPKVCAATGRCVFECRTGADCGAGFRCERHLCHPDPAKPLVCPDEMAKVADAFCIDRYEASRPDATATGVGSDEHSARSVAGVMPWQVASNAVAAQACAAAGKRLCSAAEWQLACAGPDRSVYAYGNVYDPQACNGIDAFGREAFHLAATGSFPRCASAWGAFDLNGNLWEHLAGGSDQSVRGGAYNCSDSAALHRCDYVPGSWAPSARGFRCCLAPASAIDGGAQVHAMRLRLLDERT